MEQTARTAKRYQLLRNYLINNGFVVFQQTEVGEPIFVQNTDFYGPTFEAAVDALEEPSAHQWEAPAAVYELVRQGIEQCDESRSDEAEDSMPETENRYTISELLKIAEEQTAQAKRAQERGEPDGAERYEQWSNTLAGIRIMQERGVPDSLKNDA